MKTNSTIRRAGLGLGLVGIAATALVPATAQAQQYGSSYDQRGQYYYDGCRRDQNQRAIVGGVLGALAGMAAGNNSSSRPSRRDDGAAIGTVIGGIAGASIGASTAGCAPERRTYSYQQNYQYPSYSYSPGYSYAPDYGYNNRRRDDYYYDRYAQAPGYSYDYDDRYDSYDRGARSCTYVESPVRMPDGRTQTRMVQACPDSSGRYQIVD